jgi:isocitrate dehydrogenase
MSSGDLRSNEKSTTITKATAGDATIKFIGHDGNKKVLKERLGLIDGEIIDATIMNRRALRTFLEEQVEDAKEKDVLFSVHLKATMMKVSDPIIFGHVVSVFFKDVFEKHASIFKELGVSSNNGLGDLYAKIKSLPDEKRIEIESDIQAVYEKRPRIAMVNSDKGITNLHVPSDTIIDASMPAAIRNSGRMWGPDGELHDTKFVIPDSSYAGVYQEVIDFCKKHGAFDPTKMGTVQNVGLMAQKLRNMDLMIKHF